jgi:ABC-type uncharacterized transport system permease subunit
MPVICLLPPILCYGSASVLAWLERCGVQSSVQRWGVWGFYLGLVVQTATLPFLLVLGMSDTTPHRGLTMGLLSWTCAVGIAVMMRQARWQRLAVLFFPLVLLLQIDALVSARPFLTAAASVPRWSLLLHLAIAMVAMGVTLLSAMSGGVFLWQQHRLQRGRIAARGLQLPSLPTLERTVHRLLHVGFICLTLTLGTGLFLHGERAVLGHTWHYWSAMVAWLVYGGVLYLPRARGTGPQGILLSLVGFLILLLSFLEVHGL